MEFVLALLVGLILGGGAVWAVVRARIDAAQAEAHHSRELLDQVQAGHPERRQGGLERRVAVAHGPAWSSRSPTRSQQVDGKLESLEKARNQAHGQLSEHLQDRHRRPGPAAARDGQPGHGAARARHARALGRAAAQARLRDGGDDRALRLRAAELGRHRRRPRPARPDREAARRHERRGGREGPARGLPERARDGGRRRARARTSRRTAATCATTCASSARSRTRTASPPRPSSSCSSCRARRSTAPRSSRCPT